MIPFARFRILDPLFDGLFRGKAWAITTAVVLVLLLVGLGQYNRWRMNRDNRDDSDN